MQFQKLEQYLRDERRRVLTVGLREKRRIIPTECPTSIIIGCAFSSILTRKLGYYEYGTRTEMRVPRTDNTMKQIGLDQEERRNRLN